MLSLALAACLVATNVDVAAIRKAIVPITSLSPSADLKDLEPLQKALKDAKVVGLGEATHGSKEIFEVKHRLFRFLVEKMGYTVLGLEVGMIHALPLDRYVLNGEGDPAVALRGTGFWTVDTDEHLALIEWMRAYNKDPKHKQKLRVVGIDAQDAGGVWFKLAPMLKSYGIKDPILDDEYWFRNLQGDRFDDKVTRTVQKLIDDNLAVIREKEGPEGTTILKRTPTLLRQAWTSLRPEILREDVGYGSEKVKPYLRETLQGAQALLDGSPDLPEDAKAGLRVLAAMAKGEQKVDHHVLIRGAESLEEKAGGKEALTQAAEVMRFLGMGLELNSYGLIPRDGFLAENVLWISKTLLPGSKVALWAHNSHVSRYRKDGKPLMMGAYLTDAIGKGYYPLGTAFLEGGLNAVGSEGKVASFTVPPAKAGSLEALLASVSTKPFFLNFDGLPAKSRTELSADFPWRVVGSQYREATPEIYSEPISPAKMFSGLVFVPKIKAAKILP